MNNDNDTQTVTIRVVELRVVCRDCEKTILSAPVQDVSDEQIKACATQISEKSPLEVIVE